jgi:hypothetical protein
MPPPLVYCLLLLLLFNEPSSSSVSCSLPPPLVSLTVLPAYLREHGQATGTLQSRSPIEARSDTHSQTSVPQYVYYVKVTIESTLENLYHENLYHSVLLRICTVWTQGLRPQASVTS